MAEYQHQNLKEYVESGEYFIDARKWFKHKYINPVSERSLLIVFTSGILLLAASIIINFTSLFPIIITKKYIINLDQNSNLRANIIHANQIPNKSLKSITDIMVRHYVSQRERYNYSQLEKQIINIRNTSTRLVFRRFYNYMNIDNPTSPIIRFQQGAKRNVNIVSAKYPTSNSALITFDSLAKNSAGEIIEDSRWQVLLSYEIDSINPLAINGTRYNFTVTDYDTKLLQARATGEAREQ